MSLSTSRTDAGSTVEEAIVRHRGFVGTVARRFRRYGFSLEELIDTGIVGIVDAYPQFDETRGVPFITFAKPYILSRLSDHVAAVGSAVCIPRGTPSSIRQECDIADLDEEHLNELSELHTAPVGTGRLDREHAMHLFNEAMAGLNENQREVLRALYGLGERQPLACVEVAPRRGISKTRVQQVHQQALKALRSHPAMQEARALMMA